MANQKESLNARTEVPETNAAAKEKASHTGIDPTPQTLSDHAERITRKERMHRAIGMFSKIEQDSVEMQIELRRDWD